MFTSIDNRNIGDILPIFVDILFLGSVVCYVTDLLRQVVVSLTVSFFVVFALAVQMKKFDLIESLDQILFVSMLQI